MIKKRVNKDTQFNIFIYLKFVDIVEDNGNNCFKVLLDRGLQNKQER